MVMKSQALKFLLKYPVVESNIVRHEGGAFGDFYNALRQLKNFGAVRTILFVMPVSLVM